MHVYHTSTDAEVSSRRKIEMLDIDAPERLYDCACPACTGFGDLDDLDDAGVSSPRRGRRS